MDTRVQLSALSIKNFNDNELEVLERTCEHNLAIVRKVIEDRRKSAVEVVPKAGKSKRKPAKVSYPPAKKKKATVKDMQKILSAHDIEYSKGWKRNKYCELIKKHRLVRETNKFAEVQAAFKKSARS